jgi:putative ABC transport system substrate-binding protein
MISRRRFIAGSAAVLASPLAAQEKPPRQYRIGMLDVVSEPMNRPNVDELRKGLAELGYEEGRNLRIEYRSGEARAERYAGLAAELARLEVDVIVTSGTPATLAAKNLAGSIPVVIANALDPVDTGLVASLEHPGGKVTGIAVLTEELEAKRVELLRALAPGRTRVAVLVNMSNPGLAESWKPIEAAAKKIGLEPMLVNVPRTEKIPKAFDAALAKKAQALVVRVGALPDADRRLVIDLAAKHKLPAIYAQRQFVEAGGLVSYGLSVPDMYNRAATFVDRILKGARPGELAMERPTRFEFVVNRKTLRALDLVIPPDLLLRSDEVVG